jgi:hypothetical protein
MRVMIIVVQLNFMEGEVEVYTRWGLCLGGGKTGSLPVCSCSRDAGWCRWLFFPFSRPDQLWDKRELGQQARGRGMGMGSEQGMQVSTGVWVGKKAMGQE